MGKRNFTEQFKLEVVGQVASRDRSVAEVADSFGVSSNTVYKWLKHYGEVNAEGGAEGARVNHRVNNRSHS